LILVTDLSAKNFNPEDYNLSALKVNDNSVNLDGILTEPDWQKADSISGFIQSEPIFGIPAPEETIVKVLYDENNLCSRNILL